MRTTSYVMTIKANCDEDLVKLESLREHVKLINKATKSKFYVKCQARGSRVEAAKKDNKHYKGAYFQSLPLKHAATMDVYIYTRYD